MHMVDHRVLHGHAIEIIYIIQVEWLLLFARDLYFIVYFYRDNAQLNVIAPELADI